MGKLQERVIVFAAIAFGGCNGGALDRTGQVGGAAGTGGGARADGAGASAGNGGGVGSPTGLGGSPVAGPGAPCGTLALTAPLTLAPAAAGQLYQRCGTLGPEASWTVTLSPSGGRNSRNQAALKKLVDTCLNRYRHCGTGS